MIYFDTSFLAPLFKAEGHSAEVRRFTVGLKPRLSAISRWTRVEFSSLLAKDVRMGHLTPVQANAADAAFDAFVAETCTLTDVGHRDFDLARRLLSDRLGGLRAGDALHLAIAANAGATAVYSLDKAMIAAGSMHGLPMNLGFPVPAP